MLLVLINSRLEASNIELLIIIISFTQKKKKKNIICRDTILVDPILGGQVLAQGVPHNEFLVEYGLRNFVLVSLDGLLHGPWKYRNKNEESGCEGGNFIHGHTFVQ